MLQWVEKDEEFVWRRSSVLRKSRDPAWVDARWTRACWGQTGDSETRCFSEVELVCFSFSPLHWIKVWLTERWRENVQKWWHELPPKDLETAPARQLLYLGVNSSDPSLLPRVKKKKTRRYNERVMIPCAWLPSLLGAVAHDQARHHPKKGRVCFGFFFKLPPGGGCSGCDLLVTCIRCSRGSSTVFQVVCHVQVWWWFIWCEVDDGSGEKRATSPGAMDGCFCSDWCWKCILDLFIVRFGPCCPPFI